MIHVAKSTPLSQINIDTTRATILHVWRCDTRGQLTTRGPPRRAVRAQTMQGPFPVVGRSTRFQQLTKDVNATERNPPSHRESWSVRRFHHTRHTSSTPVAARMGAGEAVWSKVNVVEQQRSACGQEVCVSKGKSICGDAIELPICQARCARTYTHHPARSRDIMCPDDEEIKVQAAVVQCQQGEGPQTRVMSQRTTSVCCVKRGCKHTKGSRHHNATFYANVQNTTTNTPQLLRNARSTMRKR